MDNKKEFPVTCTFYKNKQGKYILQFNEDISYWKLEPEVALETFKKFIAFIISKESN